jgi:hypothetical protein
MDIRLIILARKICVAPPGLVHLKKVLPPLRGGLRYVVPPGLSETSFPSIAYARILDIQPSLARYRTNPSLKIGQEPSSPCDCYGFEWEIALLREGIHQPADANRY